MTEPTHVYADSAQVIVQPFTVALRFLIGPIQDGHPPTEQAVVRLSPEQAKLFSIILRRSLKQYEERHQVVIALPASVYQQHSLSPTEDW